MTTANENFSVREAEALRPRLRESLHFSIQEHGSERVCVIEDAAASRFHRVGLPEYRFLRALDGTRPVAGILAQLAREGGDAFTEGEALQILRWAKEQHLLTIENPHARITEAEQDHRVREAVATWLNPLVLKLPLFTPDAFFGRLVPLLRPLLGWPGFLLWLIVVGIGAAHVGIDWRRLAGDTEGFFARDNWFWIFLAWMGLKVAHEFGHGIFCKYFGAPVREAGIIFVVFMPMGFVDATASIGLASRWRRIMVALAGLYVEFFLAAVAAIVWSHSEPGPLHTFAHDTLITGTLLTLFFNANPLMRFDGYFVLSDLLDIPNLATRGRTWMHRTLAWLFLGERVAKFKTPRTRAEWIVAVYGVAAWLWQLVVLAGLLMGATVALHGGGLILAVIASLTWVAMPAWQFVTSLAQGVRSSGLPLFYSAWRPCALVAVAAAILFIPWHGSISSAGVIELSDTQILRADCPGFVEKELVHDGEIVAAGQLLFELRNDEITDDLARSRLELEQQELRARLAYTRKDVATFQAEQAKSDALRSELAERQHYLATLQIRAPFAGRVTNRRLGTMHGVFVQAGEELARFGRPQGNDVKIAVSEHDEAQFRAALSQPLEIRIAGRGITLPGKLTRLEAHATRDLIHPALTALADGPLPLRKIESTSAPESHSANDSFKDYELAEPHFVAIATLDSALPLAPGEMAAVRFRGERATTLWDAAQLAVTRWLSRYATREG
ncbi:MAG TPA: HlyD family efflux transporter periplasmic adaptor subunit [Chthoniobacter sp.]|jgi:putative peptide zinc metalloprotease protein